MEYRTLGHPDLKVSAIGFGAWPIAGGGGIRYQYPAVDENVAIATVKRALDLGITLFDTAPAYGFGRSEDLLGKALEGRRDEAVIVTKVGVTYDPVIDTLIRMSHPAIVRKSTEVSLRRLRTDYIDLLLIHWPDSKIPFSEPLKEMLKLQKEGKIRFFGVSNFIPEELQDCLKTGKIVTNQMPYSLFDRRIEKELIPFCERKKISVMGYGTLAHGLLTGAITNKTNFGKDDWRSESDFGVPLFRPGYLEKNVAAVEQLTEIAKARGVTLAQLAINWVLRQNVVGTALVGAKGPSEIEENIKGVGWSLSGDELTRIDQVFTKTGATTGSGMPLPRYPGV